MEAVTDYWFTIEPYVFVGVTNDHVLLYNTFDRKIIESDDEEIISLFREMLRLENCGVVLLTGERYKQKNVECFIQELREKFMGDIIDVTLSKGKPVQLLPFFNFLNNPEVYKKHNFSPLKNFLENLSEITLYIDITTNVTKLISFLQSIPGNPTFNIIGDLNVIQNFSELLSYFDHHTSPKNILCSYKNVIDLQGSFENNYSYRVSIHFPLDKRKLHKSIHLLSNNTLFVEYIIDVSSDDDCLQAQQIINEFHIEKYQFNPVYNGENIRFFEENVYLSKEDILSTPLTIKDIFSHQAMNIYDFGKISIMANGDAYANLNYPVLGNIYIDSIYEIVHKEVEAGKSWFRIRNQAPCNSCVYQWLCPPPSNYEIAIGRSNLCHVII